MHQSKVRQILQQGIEGLQADSKNYVCSNDLGVGGQELCSPHIAILSKVFLLHKLDAGVEGDLLGWALRQ
jgi:hypothetical protein